MSMETQLIIEIRRIQATHVELAPDRGARKGDVNE